MRKLAGGANALEERLDNPRTDRPSLPPAAEPLATPYVLRLDGVLATPASLARVRERVEAINRQFQQADVPFRLRVM